VLTCESGLQAVKQLIAELQSSDTERQRVHDQQRPRIPRSDAFDELPQDVVLQRLRELKADALKAWSDTF
jgi:hypothetical protein